MNKQLFILRLPISLSLPFRQGRKDIFKKMKLMRKVIVKKRKVEKEFNNLKIIYMIYDVCEISRNEDGTTEISVSQIYNIIDVWNFEDFQELV